MRFRKERVVAWHLALTISSCVGSAYYDLGSPLGILLGAGLMAASFALQARAVDYALGPNRKPRTAFLLFFLKIMALLGFASVGLKIVGLAPMSFSFGVSLLLVAIVLETLWEAWQPSRAEEPE